MPASSRDVMLRRPRLADGIVARIRQEIGDGHLLAGGRLPTEPGLMQRFGVSRTVIREALAELRAAGLVRVVQGAGTFVAEAGEPAPEESLDLSPDELRALPRAEELRSLPRIIERLELRAGLETQAAMLAAQRATPAEVVALREAHHLVIHNARQGLSAVGADKALHLAIAAATRNPLFTRGLRMMGTAVIPRCVLPGVGGRPLEDYLATVIAEHEAIVEAIAAHDPEAARAAMLAHLGNSLRRYESLAELAR